MDIHEVSVTMLRRLMDAIKKLTADQLDQLIKGSAELTFVPPGATVVFPGPDVDEVRKQLATARTRREATDYLAGLKLKKAELVSVAKQLDIAVASKDTVPVIKRKIVESTVGVREDTAAFQDRSWRS